MTMTGLEIACIANRFFLFIFLDMLFIIWAFLAGQFWSKIKHISWKCWGMAVIVFLSVGLSCFEVATSNVLQAYMPLWPSVLFIVALMMTLIGGNLAELMTAPKLEPTIIFCSAGVSFLISFIGLIHYWRQFLEAIT